MCKIANYVHWRTPNQLYFVAICQNCGLSATSAIDGGIALIRLNDLHKKEEKNNDYSEE